MQGCERIALWRLDGLCTCINRLPYLFGPASQLRRVDVRKFDKRPGVCSLNRSPRSYREGLALMIYEMQLSPAHRRLLYDSKKNMAEGVKKGVLHAAYLV